MRKFLISLIVIMLCLVPTTTIAFAEGTEISPENEEYYFVTGDGLIFYDIEQGATPRVTPILELPKTYFIKNLNETYQYPISKKIYNAVEYKGVKGYVELLDEDKYTLITDKDTKSKLNSDTAYLKDKLTLKKDFTLLDGTILKKDTTLEINGKLLDNYVFTYNNNYIYIPIEEGYFDKYEIPKHTFPQDNNTNVKVDKNPVSPYNKLATNLVTIGIAVFCVIFVAILYFPRKKQYDRNQYDEDYYDNYKSRYDAKNNR